MAAALIGRAQGKMKAASHWREAVVGPSDEGPPDKRNGRLTQMARAMVADLAAK